MPGPAPTTRPPSHSQVGDTPQQSAARNVMRETRLDLAPSRFLGVCATSMLWQKRKQEPAGNGTGDIAVRTMPLYCRVGKRCLCIASVQRHRQSRSGAAASARRSPQHDVGVLQRNAAAHPPSPDHSRCCKSAPGLLSMMQSPLSRPPTTLRTLSWPQLTLLVRITPAERAAIDFHPAEYDQLMWVTPEALVTGEQYHPALRRWVGWAAACRRWRGLPG